MGEEMKRPEGGITRQHACRLFKQGIPVWGVAPISFDLNYIPHKIVVIKVVKGQIYPRKALFRNYWFAHAHACRINEKRLRDGHGRKR